MIKSKILRWGDYLNYPGGPNAVTRVLVSERQAGKSEKKKGDVLTKGKVGMMELLALKMAKGHKLKNASSV